MGGLQCHKGYIWGDGDFPGVGVGVRDGVWGFPGLSCRASSIDGPQEGVEDIGGTKGYFYSALYT